MFKIRLGTCLLSIRHSICPSSCRSRTQMQRKNPHQPESIALPAESPGSVPATSANAARSLAAVEWQLVMQFGSMAERLRLGRCCRALRAHMSAPFAWRHSPPLHLRFRFDDTARIAVGSGAASVAHPDALPASASASASTPDLAPSSRRPPCCHAPLSVEWLPPLSLAVNSPRLEDASSATDVEVAALLQLTAGFGACASAAAGAVGTSPQLVRLDGRGRPKVSYAHWLRILRHPSSSSLRALYVGCEGAHDSAQFDADCLAAVAQLTAQNLRAFSLHACLYHPIPSGIYKGVASLSHLTALRITDHGQPSQFGLLGTDARAPSLRRLELREPALHYIGEFVALLESPKLRALEHLTLDDFSIADDPASFSRAFAGLLHLRFVNLSMLSQSPDALLDALAHAPALEQLLLPISVSATLPSSCALDGFLSRRPTALVHLLLACWWEGDARRNGEEALERRAQGRPQIRIVEKIPALFEF
jgi:hypothetical protein